MRERGGGRRAGSAAEGGDPRRGRGRRGEQLACRHLLHRGWRIIQTNYSSRYGEIDIIARRGDTVAFIEVKARRDRVMGEPFEAVGRRKQRQIRNMAETWLIARLNSEEYRDCQFRFDVISIILGDDGSAVELNHIEDAFR